MKKFMYTLALVLLAIPSLALANVSVEVRGKCGEKIQGAQGHISSFNNMTVFEATVKVVKDQGGIDVVPNTANNYVESIAGLGEAREETAEGTHAWGWHVVLCKETEIPVIDLKIKEHCSELTGSAMEQTIPSGEKAKVKWTYGYMILDKNANALNKDGSSCKGGENCFYEASSSDCKADAKDAK